MRESLKRQDYHNYTWKKGERLLAVAQSALAAAVPAYFFYRSAPAALLLTPLGIFYFRRLKKNKRDARKRELVKQFKECILSVAASLRAGYALENAFLESRLEIKLLYGERSWMYQELEWIRRGLVIHISLEELFADFAERSECEEILQFAQILAIARKKGGNMPQIIQSTAELIGRRIDASLEMQTLLSGRRMEQKVMRLMPFGILFYIGASSPGYFDVLYHNGKGAAVMSLCLAIYLAAYLLGDRILQKVAREMS